MVSRSGFGVLGRGYRDRGFGSRFHGSEFRAASLGFVVSSSRFRVSIFGVSRWRFRDRGSGFVFGVPRFLGYGLSG